MIQILKTSAMIILLTGAVFVVSHPQAVSASEATADPETEEAAPEEADKKPSDKPANSSEVFIPTEEISEDFAVSFPVDI